MTDAEWAKHRKNDKLEKLSEEEWEDLNDMATSTICLCLANNTLREVLGLTDPVDIWDKLESRYKSKSLTSRLYLKQRLFGLQMAEEANFNGHLDEFNKITTELESIDVKIEEEDKALLLLASLPSSFDNIVTTLLFEKETLKFDEVVAVLLMNESKDDSSVESHVGNDVDSGSELLNEDDERSNTVGNNEEDILEDIVNVDTLYLPSRECYDPVNASTCVVVDELALLEVVNKVAGADDKQADNLISFDTIKLFDIIEVVKMEHLVPLRVPTYVIGFVSYFLRFSLRATMVENSKSGLLLWFNTLSPVLKHEWEPPP
ncbi:unnamed protein product [Cuscuta campestris]|uniref:Retrovirus-related Pol polyprotein from transposon TNT 1-94 n=1 Tax=Cuscuta campestris TaxID=132261 RepID=A0A484L5S4_9ASTE|nr:unnamed protein product [Cuscuta campestris]